jgi:hypothetical protein
VPLITIVFGAVLIGLALIGYFPTQAPTALIPGGFGVVLLILGVLALREKLRMHAMHGAVMVGLLGFIAATVRAIQVAMSENFAPGRAFAMVICMALTCGVFVALCVKSFIDARRRRKAQVNS